jgi:adenylate cyclase
MSAGGPSLSEVNRSYILRVIAPWSALFLLLMHVPFGLAIGRVHWLDTLLPSACVTCLHFLMPAILKHYGSRTGAVWLLGVSMLQTFVLALWTGESAGIHYYFFSISAVAISLLYGYRRAWMATFALLPMLLFAIIELAVPARGLVITIDPAISPYLSAANGLASFLLFIAIGVMFSHITAEAERQLALEKDRSERLLLNILPEPIAARLKTGVESVIADRIDEVSVMFADLVGFTPYAREREPVAVVGMLNDLFSRFDDRVTSLGLEKIKTVGDAYMVVAGAPDRRPDHLEALARLALGLVEEVARFTDADGSRFAIRIGLHVGPVVTGVIGTRKMAYDVWGDTVNVAARLESTGTPNRIHVSPEIVRRLDGRFAFEPRGEIEIKGVGMMTTSFLTASS